MDTYYETSARYDETRDTLHDPELGRRLEDEHKINEERQR